MAWQDSFLRRLALETRGSVFVMGALTAMGVIGSVGLAVDVGRAQMAENKLQNALDAAGLAAGSSINTTDLETVVNKYLALNFNQGNLGAVITEVTPVLSADGQLLTVTATATLDTTFMKIFNHDSVTLHAETEITRTNKGMELALVLDITGSMCIPSCTNRLDALKTASYDLFEILFGEDETTAENLWIGIVPFSMGVNVGSAHTDWLDTIQYQALDWGTTSWRGCTEARWEDGNDLTDATPATEKFLAYYWQDDADNDWREVDTQDITTTNLCGPTSSNSCRCTPATGGHSGGTYVCGTTVSGTTSTRIFCTNQTSSSNKRCRREVTTQHAPIYTYDITSLKGPNTYCPTVPVTRLTNNRTTLDAAITALTAEGGTHIPEGAAWGWRMLSPNWRGLWGGTMDSNNLPLDYNTPLMVKAAIIMTDGENTMYDFADGAYGYIRDNHVGMTHSGPYDVDDAGLAADRLDAKLTQICANMKAQGIVVYTVLFDVDDEATQTMMRTCATQPDYFFNSPDAAALKTAFRTIGDSLANLRISR